MQRRLDLDLLKERQNKMRSNPFTNDIEKALVVKYPVERR
jgi:hypothetical protein